MFDQLRASGGLSKHLEVALQAATDTAADIRVKGRISPSKHVYSELSPPTTRYLGGDNFLDQFQDAYSDPTQILEVKQSHLAVLDNFNKRIKVQESISSKENMARCDQDMVEMQNWFGPRNPNKASSTITEQLSVMKKLEK